MSWNNLTIAQKSQLMNIMRRNGITSLSDMKNIYDSQLADFNTSLEEATDTFGRPVSYTYAGGGKKKPRFDKPVSWYIQQRPDLYPDLAKMLPEYLDKYFYINDDGQIASNLAYHKYTNRNKSIKDTIGKIGYNQDNEIMLTTDAANARYRTGRISTDILDYIYDNAAKAKVPFRDALGLAGKESTLGIGRGYKRGNGISPIDLFSFWVGIGGATKTNKQMEKLTQVYKDMYEGKRVDQKLLDTSEFEFQKMHDNLHEFAGDNWVKAAYDYYKAGKYNPGEKGYDADVIRQGDAILSDRAVQKWLKTKQPYVGRGFVGGGNLYKTGGEKDNYRDQLVYWATNNPGALWADTDAAYKARKYLETNYPEDFASLYWGESEETRRGIDKRMIPTKAKERAMEDAVRTRDKAAPYVAGALAGSYGLASGLSTLAAAPAAISNFSAAHPWAAAAMRGVDVAGSIDGIGNLVSGNGIQKTIRKAKEGDTWGAIKSGVGDAFDLVGGLDAARMGTKLANSAYRAYHAYNTVSPYSYENMLGRGKDWAKSMLLESQYSTPKWEGDEISTKALNDLAGQYLNPGKKKYIEEARKDAWRLYLGQGQKYNTYTANPDGTYSYNLEKFKELYPEASGELNDILSSTFSNNRDYIADTAGGLTQSATERYLLGNVGDPQAHQIWQLNIEDTWDLQPFSRGGDALIGDRLSKTLGKKFDFLTQSKAAKKVDKKLKSFEAGKTLGGNPFVMRTQIPYTTHYKRATDPISLVIANRTGEPVMHSFAELGKVIPEGYIDPTISSWRESSLFDMGTYDINSKFTISLLTAKKQ